MPKDDRANLKISKGTYAKLSRYARSLAVELDRRVTLDEAIVHALEVRGRKEVK